MDERLPADATYSSDRMHYEHPVDPEVRVEEVSGTFTAPPVVAAAAAAAASVMNDLESKATQARMAQWFADQVVPGYTTDCHVECKRSESYGVVMESDDSLRFEWQPNQWDKSYEVTLMFYTDENRFGIGMRSHSRFVSDEWLERHMRLMWDYVILTREQPSQPIGTFKWL